MATRSLGPCFETQRFRAAPQHEVGDVKKGAAIPATSKVFRLKPSSAWDPARMPIQPLDHASPRYAMTCYPKLR
jgi:hypothetical protein